MNYLSIILFIGLSFFSCANGLTDTNVEVKQDQLIHANHNANMIRQINNDMIINRSVNSSASDSKTTYALDNKQFDQSSFLAMPLDTIFYVNKIMNSEEDDVLQIAYKGYTLNYYTEHAFTPDEFNLSFDETDQLVLTVKHDMKGELYAYGFEKQSGKQAIRPYHSLDFDGLYVDGQGLISRQVDELRFVLTIADSIYIHDFKVEDFYRHDH